MSRVPEEQLVHFLSDLYSMELQAIAQLETAPNMAENTDLAANFSAHCRETESQAKRVRERLVELGGSPSAIKDGIMKLGGKGFLLFARLLPETPGRLVAHAYSYEAMEWAAYASLVSMADILADNVTAKLGRDIQAEEARMMRQLEKGFDAAEAVSHHDLAEKSLPEHVRRHLTEVHALEAQAIKLLEKAERITKASELDGLYTEHLDSARAQLSLVEQRLEAIGASPSMIKDAAMKMGGADWGLFFQSQKDTPVKLAIFVYATEHLKIAGYELLRRVAKRAGDEQTESLCRGILENQREKVAHLAASLDRAVQTTFHALQS